MFLKHWPAAQVGVLLKKGGFKDNCIVIVSYMMITADDKTKIFPKIRENYSLGTRSFLTFILLYSK